MSIWAFLAYIMVRMIFFYLSFWALTLLVMGIFSTAMAAGRQVVEGKMIAQLRKDERIAGSPVHVILEADLPEEEKSVQWKRAILYYSLALPLTIVTPFFFYLTPMRDDSICYLASISGSIDST